MIGSGNRHPNELPAGLRAAYVLVLTVPAMVAPLPLFWTEGASPSALAFYEAAILFLWWRAHEGSPVRLSDGLLNVIGLSYFFFLAFEITQLRHGLLRSVSHLLLFTAVAKLASLKRPGEARTALLVLFLLTLASASSSTHFSSLLYFLAMALLAFRALCRLAVLADFEEAPPDNVLRSIPTGGLAATSLAVAGILTVPLFYSLPRLRSPFALAPVRLEESLSTVLTADRVELQNFGPAKRSDRVILSLQTDPSALLPRVLRLREAVFTDYHLGVWTRTARRRDEAGRLPAPIERPRPNPRVGITGTVSIDLNLFTNGFLFLPYGSSGLRMERGYPIGYTDGVFQVGGVRRSLHYTTTVRPIEARGVGSSAMDSRQVPAEVRAYAMKLTGDTDNPDEIYRRIEQNFQENFLYTLDPPHTDGDPIVHFLLRSKAGHCEYFASATVLMLTARGIPARLVTGSYGGEVGFFSRSFVVKGTNLHAWVEANLDGAGFSVLDPTPEAGLPPATRQVDWWTRLTTLGRDVEFFYDRRILGFDSIDQAMAMDAARRTLDKAASTASSWKRLWKETPAAAGGWALGVVLLVGLLFFAAQRWSRRARLSPATRAYLALRHLIARREGFLSPAVAPADVARLVARAAPEGREDAEEVVRVYCADAFGGIKPAEETVRELEERVRRLKKLA